MNVPAHDMDMGDSALVTRVGDPLEPSVRTGTGSVRWQNNLRRMERLLLLISASAAHLNFSWSSQFLLLHI
jgi:hypothetical protein